MRGPAAWGEGSRLEAVPGKMLLKVREGAVAPALRPGGMSFSAGTARLLPESVEGPIDYLRRNAGLRDLRPVFSSRRASLERASVSSRTRQRLALLTSVADSESEALRGIMIAEAAPTKVDEDLIRHLRRSQAIEYVELMPARWIMASGGAAMPDPRTNLQWGLRAIDWFNADMADASEIRVAVLDTGVDRNHPNLSGVIDEYDTGGFSTRDIVGHGTHVAGTIAAVTQEATSPAGVVACRLAIYKIFPDQPYRGQFYVDGGAYLQALRAVASSGARVLNLSIGGPARSQTEALLFQHLERQGVCVVAAMGNEYERGNRTSYPAAYGGVLAVGAIGETLMRAPFSNTGKHIGVVAPGENILSTLPMKAARPYRSVTCHAVWDGTSMATPHVAGGATLVAARFPELTADKIRDRLMSTARKLPDMSGRDRTDHYGYGMVDLVRALS